MPGRTKPLRPEPSDRADWITAWLSTKSVRWYLLLPLGGALVAVALCLPLHPSWHEMLAWVLVGTAAPLTILAMTVATLTSERSLIAEGHSLEDLRSLSWLQFEEFVGALFRARKWQVVQTQREGDGGVDLIIKKARKFGYVQCKQWQRQVGVAPVRAFYGAMAANKITNGFFVTTTDFSPEAERFAQSVGIELIGGGKLMRYVRIIQRQKGLVGAADAERASEPAPDPSPVIAPGDVD